MSTIPCNNCFKTGCCSGVPTSTDEYNQMCYNAVHSGVQFNYDNDTNMLATSAKIHAFCLLREKLIKDGCLKPSK